MLDGKAIGSQVLEAVRGYVSRSLSELSARIADIDSRLKSLPAPKDGNSVTVDELRPVVEQAVLNAVAAIPVPKDGTSVTVEELRPKIEEAVSKAVAALPPPKDGESVTLDEVAPLIEQAVTERIAAIPVPKNGTSVGVEDVLPALSDVIASHARESAKAATDQIPPPKDGLNAYEVAVSLGYEGTVHEWMDSLRGKSVTVDELKPICENLVSEAVSSIPVPKNGTSVTPEQVLPELRKELQTAIAALPVPTGVTVGDFRQMFEAEQAKWALDFERRAQDVLRHSIEQIPIPKNGIDGLGFDDMEVAHDGERTMTLRFSRGEQVKEFSFKIPAVIERGVFKEGTTYERGDGVTRGGSYWIALKDTSSKPGDKDSDWRLAVKSGRQGRSAYDIARDAGFTGSEREWIESLKGKPGRDLSRSSARAF